MLEGFKKIGNSAEQDKQKVIEVGFEVVQTYPVRIERFVMCNGKEHWSTEQVVGQEGEETAVTPNLNPLLDKTPCNCPDPANRVSIWDKFKS